MRRAGPDAAATLVLTKLEITLLDRLVPDKKQNLSDSGTLPSYLTKVAQLGGYLARTKDPPAGRHRHVARSVQAHRHQPGFHARAQLKQMWVIASLAGRIQFLPSAAEHSGRLQICPN